MSAQTVATQHGPLVPLAPTLAVGSGSPHLAANTGHDHTLPPSEAPDIAPRVIVRAGGQEDYRALAAVDPKHYVIGREIARGGMGRISVARDRRLGRSVALKELLIDSDVLRARFEREARITAKLQHPSIVSLLEAGVWPNGEPFYVMKLVSGESLDKVIAARPTLASRLGLVPHVIAVVDALAYAHAARVIHRDLKPANVLVGEYGETVVIDWGLAKDFSDPSDTSDVAVGPVRAQAVDGDNTRVGSILGTPAYMPIEQAEGEAVDQRADVYALGAMLYHVLAGTPPYTGRSADNVLEAVIAGPPSPIELSARDAPRDLLAIVNKAMARSASDRYPTAKELVEDLKRFQTGQLVGAHQYSSWQLASRWLRRHRTAVAVASVATVVLGVLAVVGLRKIFDEQARTEAQRVLAVQKGQDAEGLIDFMMGDLKEKLKPLGKIELLDETAKKAMAYYDRKGEQLSPTERGKRALAHRNLGDVLLLEGHADLALSEYRTSLVHAQVGLMNRLDGRSALLNLARSHAKIGEALETKNLKEAIAAYEAALSVVEPIAALADAGPTWTEYRAYIHQRIGTALWKTDAARAMAEHQAALALFETMAAAAPNDKKIRKSISGCHSTIARIQGAQGDTDGALAHVRKAFAIDEEIAADDPANVPGQRSLMFDRHEIAKLLTTLGDVKSALSEYRSALAIAKRLAAQDPRNAKTQDDLAVCHARLGDFLKNQQDIAGALAEYEAGLAIDEHNLALEPANESKQQAVSFSRLQIGELHRRKGDLRSALTNFEAYLAISETLAASEPSDVDRQRNVAVGNVYVGNLLLDSKDTAGALRRYRSAVAVFEKRIALDPTNLDRQWDVTEAKQLVGDALLAQHNPAGALAEYTAVKSMREPLSEKDPENVGWRGDLAGAYVRVGDAQLENGDRVRALTEYKAGLAIARELAAQHPEHPALARFVEGIVGKVAEVEHKRSSRARHRAIRKP